MPNVTIKAVARDAGVSIATVSRVLNKNYAVSPELQERVQRSIEKLQYYPNSVARSLKNDSTHSIGLIVSDISNDYFCALARSVEDIIMRQNYNLIVCSTDSQHEKELSYMHLLLGKKVDGLIINTSGNNDALISASSRDIPIVLCGRKVNDPSFRGDFVDSDNQTGSYMLTRHVIEKGHRRIAIINGQMTVSSARERLAGFAQAMQTIGVDVDESYRYYIEGNFNQFNSGYDAARQLMQMDDPPTAIIAMNNLLCTGALRYCHDHGVLIPQDVSLCSYGRIQNSELLYVEPSYIVMDPFILGRRIGEQMLERLASKNELANQEIRFSATLVEGSGVCPPKS